MATAKRTTHRSTAGKKLYAVRNAQGEFKDIQTYERAHGSDVQRKSKPEAAAKAKKAAKAAPKKRAAVKKAVKKVVRKIVKKAAPKRKAAAKPAKKK